MNELTPAANSWRHLILLTALLFLFAGGKFFLPEAAKLRQRQHYSMRRVEAGAPPEYILTSALLGGFRGVFITGLWFRAQEMKNEGKFHEMIAIYNVITKLQPNHAAAWAFQSWDLAYNVSVEFTEDYETRIFWVFRGIDLLRQQGIPKNPRIPELYYDLAWIFSHKIGGETDFAHPFYRAHLARQVQRLLYGIRPEDWRLLKKIDRLQKEYPTREKFLAAPDAAVLVKKLEALDFDIFRDAAKLLSPQPPEKIKPLLADRANRRLVQQAGLWSIGQRLRAEIGMDAGEMYRLCVEFGPIDWTGAFAHSLYWSMLARRIHREVRPAELTLKYERTVYSSLMNLIYSGQTIKSFGGKVYGVPNFDFVDGVLNYMDKLFEYYVIENAKAKAAGKRPISLTGVRSGYENLLQNLMIYAWLEERRGLARKMRAKLIEFTGNRGRYNKPLQLLVAREIKDMIDSMSTQRATSIVYLIYRRACFYLALGNLDEYHKRLSKVKALHNYCSRRWNPAEEEHPGSAKSHLGRFPSFFEARMNVVIGIFLGRVSYFRRPELLRSLAARLQQIDPKLWRAVSSALEGIRQQREEFQRQQDPAL